VERGRGAAAGNLFERPQRAAATTAVAGKPARRGANGGGRGRPRAAQYGRRHCSFQSSASCLW
jgi:hypothetical protein